MLTNLNEALEYLLNSDGSPREVIGKITGKTGIELLKNVYSTSVRSFGDNDPDTQRARIELATEHYSLGQNDEANALLKKAHDIDLTVSKNVWVGRDIIGIAPELYEEMLQATRDELRADLEAKHAEAQRADKAELSMLAMQIERLSEQLDEYEKRLADPDQAYAEYIARINELEHLLEESTVEIGDNRINDAFVAMEVGDYSLADQIFSETENHEDVAVKRVASAAYGRGMIAEDAVKWHDADKHFTKAAQLDPTSEHLEKAQTFAWRAGHYTRAETLGRMLLDLVAKEDGCDAPSYAIALNNLALMLYALGKYPESEALYIQALDIDRASIGEAHPDFAKHLNNLAEVMHAQGRYLEAEALYMQVLDIDRATIGEAHPDFAIHLNNLARGMHAQGRYLESEALYMQTLDIDHATIGEAHPDFAIHLNNLAGVVEAQGRYPEAEALYIQALDIDRATIGEAHPSFASHLNNLAGVVEAQGRYPEADGYYKQAVGILRQSLGDEHPDTQSSGVNYLLLLIDHIPNSPDIKELQSWVKLP